MLWPNTLFNNISTTIVLYINTESLQLIHRNDLKIKCKYKSLNLIFWRSSGDEASGRR